jgi:hypothetical protein
VSNAAEFLRALVPHVQATLRRNPKPLLMVDENLDREPVWRTANALFVAGCVFHAIPITDSTANRSPIPRQFDH